MKKRFIVSLNKTTKEQEEKFVEYLNSEKLAWWHWLSHTWLIIDFNGKHTVDEIRSSVVDIFASEYNLVIELKGMQDTWAGFGPTADDHNMFRWLNENWKG